MRTADLAAVVALRAGVHSQKVERHGRTVLALFVLALFVHDIFGPHGFIAMRRTQNEIQKVQKDFIFE